MSSLAWRTRDCSRSWQAIRAHVPGPLRRRPVWRYSAGASGISRWRDVFGSARPGQLGCSSRPASARSSRCLANPRADAIRDCRSLHAKRLLSRSPASRSQLRIRVLAERQRHCVPPLNEPRLSRVASDISWMNCSIASPMGMNDPHRQHQERLLPPEGPPSRRHPLRQARSAVGLARGRLLAVNKSGPYERAFIHSAIPRASGRNEVDDTWRGTVVATRRR